MPRPGQLTHPQSKTKSRRLDSRWDALPPPTCEPATARTTYAIRQHRAPGRAPYHPPPLKFRAQITKPSPGGSVLGGVHICSPPCAIDLSRPTDRLHPTPSHSVKTPQIPPTAGSHPQSKIEPWRLDSRWGAPPPSHLRPTHHSRYPTPSDTGSSPPAPSPTATLRPEHKPSPGGSICVGHPLPLVNPWMPIPSYTTDQPLSPSPTAFSY